ncbi:hypothetical protein BGZ83_008476 [Gryganskiella cystojenkinii]|nr:hypothetical protein BGZ83_008476 [Gryganskiella cystojenkinii]
MPVQDLQNLDLSNCKFMGPYTVQGKTSPFILSAAVETDIPEMVRILNLHPSIFQNTGPSMPVYPYLESHGQEKIAQTNEFRRTQGYNSLFAIRTSVQGPLIGWIQYIPVPDYDPPHIHPVTKKHVQICLLGYWVSPDHQGNGYASRAAQFLIDEILFKPEDDGGLGYDIIRAGSYYDNVASRKVLESAGLKVELERKEEFSKKLNIWRDVCTYGRHREPEHTGHILIIVNQMTTNMIDDFKARWGPVPPTMELMGPFEIPGRGDHTSPLYLSAVTPDDIPEMIRVLNLDTAVYLNTGSFQYPYLESHAIQRMDNVYKWRAEFGFNNRWAMRTSPEGPLVGWIHCFPVPNVPYVHPTESRPVKIVELGYWVSLEYRNKGFGSRSTKFVVDEIIFKRLNGDIARAIAYTDNVGSQKVLMAAGMRVELASKKMFVEKLQMERESVHYAVHRDHTTDHILHDGTI